MSKRSVYLFDLGTGADTCLLPLSSGLVGAYAMSQAEIASEYNVHLRLTRKGLGRISGELDNPSVVGFASYVWNANASAVAAAAIKAEYPNAKIVMGGYSVPGAKERIADYFGQHPHIDVLVHGEGELTFAHLLKTLSDNRDLSSVPGITFRDNSSDNGFVTTLPRARVDNLDDLPSPFLNGMFNKILRDYGQLITGTVWETNRGCPFACTFCGWGHSTVNKVKQYDIERLRAELAWIGKNEISYIFCGDANFGIFYERDLQIAREIAEMNRVAGHPKFFTTNWTKNSHERITAIADILAKQGVVSGITMSLQSRNTGTLKAIKRVNLREDKLKRLKSIYDDRDLPSYTELILGLPEETIETVRAALDEIMTPRLNNHFIFYPCSVLENTPMADPEYLRRYGIQTSRCKSGISRRTFDSDYIPEFEDIVTGVSSMPREEWKQTYLYVYFCMCMYNHRLCFFIANFLRDQFGVSCTDFFDFVLANVRKDEAAYPVWRSAVRHIEKQRELILLGESLMSVPEGLAGLTLTPHEGALALCIQNIDHFYREAANLLQNYSNSYGLNIPVDLQEDLIRYQQSRVARWPGSGNETERFRYNLPEYFAALTRGKKVPPIEANVSTVLVERQSSPAQTFEDFFRTYVRSGHRVSVAKVSILKTEEMLAASQ